MKAKKTLVLMFSIIALLLAFPAVALADEGEWVDPEQKAVGTYFVTGSANPAGWGYVTGTGTYAGGQTATLYAVPNPGYTFTGWIINGNTVVSTTANPYTFSVNSNTYATALFEHTTGVFSVVANSSPAGAGYIDGGGSYSPGEMVTLAAHPNQGYRFSYWIINGASRYSEANPYTFAINQHINAVAVFTQTSGQFTVTTSANPTYGGYVIGGGSYAGGAPCTLTAVPNDGYVFTGWTLNGYQEVGTNPTYRFNVTENAYFTANFRAASGAYVVHTSSSPTAGGYVLGGGNYNAGQRVSLRAVPNPGYVFTGWIINGYQHIGYTNPYEFTVTQNVNAVAIFTNGYGTYSVSTSSSPISGGYVTGAGYYSSGETVTLHAVPNPGYQFAYWIINGNYVYNYRTYTFTVYQNTHAVAVFTGQNQEEVESLTLIPSTLNMVEGEDAQLNYRVYPEDAYYNSISWSSSNPSVATVDTNGTVTAVASGDAVITARVNNGVAGTCRVTVTPKTINVEGITLSQTTGTVVEGETLALTATVSPEDATNKGIVWSSSDTSVAEVSDAGVITGVAPGTATITAESADGNASATCAIEVTPKEVPVTSVAISQTEADLLVGETLALTATVEPEDATNKSVVWSSSDTSIITVDQNGLVTAVAPGRAVISATTEDGSRGAACAVNVASPTVPAQSITVTPSVVNLTTAAGGTSSASLTASVSPSNATDAVTWSNNNPTVARLTPSGTTATVTALNDGVATITVTAGNQRAVATVNVYEGAVISDGIEVTSSSPDEFTVTAINVRANPAMQGSGSSIDKVSFFAWSVPDQSDMDAKIGQVNGNNWSCTFPVNDDGVNNYFFYGDNIKVNVYASNSPTSDGSLIGAQTYSWVSNVNAAGHSLAYIGYVQNIGFDKPTVFDGAQAGTTGRALQLEGLRISSNVPGVEVETTVFAHDLGWMDPVGDGAYAGTMGQNRKIESIQLNLTGPRANEFTIRYRVHQANIGWTPYYENGESAGSLYVDDGEGYQLEAIEALLVPNQN